MTVLLNLLSGGKGFRTVTTVSISVRPVPDQVQLLQEVKEALHVHGWSSQSIMDKVNFRIDVATTAAVNGLEDSIIKILGRWKSLACLH